MTATTTAKRIKSLYCYPDYGIKAGDEFKVKDNDGRKLIFIGKWWKLNKEPLYLDEMGAILDGFIEVA